MFFLYPESSRLLSCVVTVTCLPDAAAAGFWGGNGNDLLQYVGTVEAGIVTIRSVMCVVSNCCHSAASVYFDRKYV